MKACDETKIALIIPAAGMSRRHPPNKLLIPVDDKTTVIERTVETFIGLVAEIIVVTGFQSDRIRRLLTARFKDRIHFAHNPNFAIGLASSIRSGLGAVDTVCNYYGFCLGDKPFVQRNTVRELLDTLNREKPPMLLPMFGETNGHPVFFHRFLRDELLSVYGDKGGRTVLQKWSDKALKVRVKDEGVILDMDIHLENRGEK